MLWDYDEPRIAAVITKPAGAKHVEVTNLRQPGGVHTVSLE
jgi:hypothetical protein